MRNKPRTKSSLSQLAKQVMNQSLGRSPAWFTSHTLARTWGQFLRCRSNKGVVFSQVSLRPMYSVLHPKDYYVLFFQVLVGGDKILSYRYSFLFLAYNSKSNDHLLSNWFPSSLWFKHRETDLGGTESLVPRDTVKVLAVMGTKSSGKARGLRYQSLGKVSWDSMETDWKNTVQNIENSTWNFKTGMERSSLGLGWNSIFQPLNFG